MRKLQPVKAILHAITSVRNYAAVGIRFSLPWAAIMLMLNAANLLTSDPGTLRDPAQVSPLEFASSIVGAIAFSSVAVNWHRFILRDEAGGNPMRLDGPVWRYLGNSLLMTMMVFLPFAVLAAIVLLFVPAAAVLLVPAALLSATFFLALSPKLPAVAIGQREFGFRDALKSTQSNFWPLLGLLMLNSAAILLVLALAMMIIAASAALSETLSIIVILALNAVFDIFLLLYSISLISSLYGFFVEKRDF